MFQVLFCLLLGFLIITSGFPASGVLWTIDFALAILAAVAWTMLPMRESVITIFKVEMVSEPVCGQSTDQVDQSWVN